MPESTICKTKRDGTIRFSDLGGVNSYEVSFETGDLNATIPGPVVNVALDRGEFGANPCLRFGDDQASTGTFSAYLRDVTDATVEALMDFITDSGFYAATWVSTNGANSEVRVVLLTFIIEGTDHGDPADHTIAFNHSYITGSIAEGDPSTISIAFTSYERYPVTT